MSETITVPTLSAWLSRYSTEILPGHRGSTEIAGALLAPGTEVFVASLPSNSTDQQIDASVRLMQRRLKPIPHIVARNIQNLSELERMLRRLTVEAQVERVLVLSGDRDKPVGDLESSLQILESGLIEKYGIRSVFISAYPEVHPRISASDLSKARTAKLDVARRAGLAVTFLSQFCFDPTAIIRMARELRSQGITEPLRVGVAGPASHASLLKFALLCGIGASIRALNKGSASARNLLSSYTPLALLEAVAEVQHAEPHLGMEGAHFFTFGSVAGTARWVRGIRRSPG
jgi:methylenetetrahydrofolate reductase (NADPH)